LRLFDNGAQRASNLFTGARALILAVALVGVGGLGSISTVAATTVAPSTTAAAPIKVVIIVGPTGAGTAQNVANARQLATQVRGYGATVIELYSPGATWSRVVSAAQGANILIYMGHGNGWPSPYPPVQENTKDGFGLNATANAGNVNLKYYGGNFIRASIHLAPNAVVILRGLCYSAGNSEAGMPNPTVSVGRQRIQNFAAGFLAVGAKAVFAEPYGDVSYILTAMFTTKSTARQIWMAHSLGGSSSYVVYPSQRTVGAHLIAQLDGAGHFRRSLTGSLDLVITTLK
jgi:hypothetical protein